MSIPVNIIGTNNWYYNAPVKQEPVNSQYFNYFNVPYNQYTYDKNGKNIGKMSQLECENNCLYNTTCNSYSLFYPNNPTTSDINNYNCYLNNTNQIFPANDGQGRGIFTKNSNYKLNLDLNYKNSLNISDDYQVLSQNVNNNISYNTMCRTTPGNTFDSSKAKGLGYMSPTKCANNCFINNKCNSFDIARPDSNGNYDCYNFLIDNSIISGVNENTAKGCFKRNTTTQEIRPNLINNLKSNISSKLGIPTNYNLLIKDDGVIIDTDTMCRPLSGSVIASSKGRVTAKKCADDCNSYGACAGFDIARPDSNGNYDCYHHLYSNMYGENINTNGAKGCFKKNK